MVVKKLHLWSLWSVMVMTTLARLLLLGAPWSRTMMVSSRRAIASRFNSAIVVMTPAQRHETLHVNFKTNFVGITGFISRVQI